MRTILAICCVWVLGLAAPLAAGEGASPAAGDGSAARRERLEALRSRIAELEEALRAASARSLPSTPPHPVHTAGGEGAAAGFQPGAAGAEYLERLRRLVEDHDGAALSREIERHLTGGEKGFAVLRDFLSDLDRHPNIAPLLSTQYRNSFALMNLAMIHPEESARFAHYYLAATDQQPDSPTRLQIYNFISVFLEYRPGKFPDLENALKRDILAKLEQGQGDLSILLGTARALRFFPDIELIWSLLLKAASLQEKTFLIQHLAARDDSAGASALISYISRQQSYTSPETALAMEGLAHMTVRAAQAALENYLSGRDPRSVPAAVKAYFTVPREPESAPIALKLLNSGAPLYEKRLFLADLLRLQPAVHQAILDRLGEVTAEDIRALLDQERGSKK